MRIRAAILAAPLLFLPAAALLAPAPALAEQFPPTLPASTVYGRLGIGSGPGQAIPFTTLASLLAQELTIDGSVTPEMFGADGTPAGDTQGIQAAIDSGAKLVRFLPRAYKLMPPGLTGVSDQRWVGAGRGLTSIESTSTVGLGATSDNIYFTGKQNIIIEGITFDLAGFGTGTSRFPNLLPCIHLSGCDNWFILDCEFIGFTTVAVLANIARVWLIDNNTVTRATAATGPATGNHGIVISGSPSPNESHTGLITRNVCSKCQISVNGHDIGIDNNLVSGWGFSAGINTQALADCYNLSITNNHCFASNQAVDANGYFIAGIENWASRSTIAGNKCYGNYGSGIDNGGAKCAIYGNECWNNGAGTTTGGITMHYQDATFNASGSRVFGNVCYDTRSGGSKTQAYGYYEHASLTDITVSMSNNFAGNINANPNYAATARTGHMAGLIAVEASSGFTGGVSQLLGSLSLANSGFHHFIASGGTLTANKTVTFSGNFNTTFTVAADSNVTLPATGTLATLAGTENLSNKTLTTSTSLTLSQNGATTLSVSNTDAGASATAALIATTNAGSLTLQASSTAGSAVSTFRWTGAGAFFLDCLNATGNFSFRTGAGPTAALTISSAQVVAFEADRGARFNNQTSAAAAQSGTLTNAPAAGNPGFWLKINIGGTNYAIPCWAG